MDETQLMASATSLALISNKGGGVLDFWNELRDASVAATRREASVLDKLERRRGRAMSYGGCAKKCTLYSSSNITA